MMETYYLQSVYSPIIDKTTITKSNTFQECMKYPNLRAKILNIASMMNMQVNTMLKYCNGRAEQSLVKEK